MKKLLFTLAALVLMLGAASPSFAAGSITIDIPTTIIAGAAEYTSSVQDLGVDEGYYSLQLTVGDAGTLSKVEIMASNDGIKYTEPTGATDVITSMTVGRRFVQFAAPLARYMCLKFTAAAGSQIVVSGYLLRR